MKPTSESRTPKVEPQGKRSRRDARKCILLVDDDAGVRGSLRDVLVEEGYFVIPAHDGQQALELIGSLSVDLVLLDLNMPRKNGWDTFERLSAEHPLVPIVLITGRPNQLFTALGAGVGALLEKPLDIETLLRTITRLLAESYEIRLARLAGRETEFFYAPSEDRKSIVRPQACALPPHGAKLSAQNP